MQDAQILRLNYRDALLIPTYIMFLGIHIRNLCLQKSQISFYLKMTFFFITELKTNNLIVTITRNRVGQLQTVSSNFKIYLQKDGRTGHNI